MFDRRPRGRHRAPTATGRTITRAAVVTAVASAPVAVAAPAMAAPSQAVRDAVMQCESGGRNIEHGGDPGGVSTASGFFQFVNGTWRLFGGGEFAARAIGASKAEQTVVFDRAFAANGLRDWEASRACWGPKLGRHASDQEAPQPAAQPARHAAPAAPAGGTYVVRPGDTLSKIAAAHHTTWQKLFAANRDVVDNPDRIFVGEHLRT